MSEVSSKVLIEEIQSAIEGIKNADSAKCHAHEPLARGVITLLRVAKVQMELNVRACVVAGVTSSIVTGVLVGALAFLKVI